MAPASPSGLAAGVLPVCWILAIASALLPSFEATFHRDVFPGTLAASGVALVGLCVLGLPHAARPPVRLDWRHGVWLAAILELAATTWLGPGGYLGFYQAAQLASFFVLAVLVGSLREAWAVELTLVCVAICALVAAASLIGGAGGGRLAGANALALTWGPVFPLMAGMSRCAAWPRRVVYGAAAAGIAVIVAFAIARPAEAQRGEMTRSFGYRVALASISAKPTTFLYGQGLDSFSRRLDQANPADYGFVQSRISAERIESEVLEWWHGGGVVALIALFVLWASTWVGQLKAARSATGDRRILCISLLVSMSVWVVFATTGDVRNAGAQLVFALLVSLCWRVEGVAGRAFASWTAWAGLVLLGAIAASVTWPYLASERRLLQSARVEAADSGGENSQAWARAALRWKSGNLEARYRLLRSASRRGDLDAAAEQYRELARRAPSFRDADVIYGMALLRGNRLREAADRLRSFQSRAPFDYEPALVVPLLARQLGDRELLEASLWELLVHAVLDVAHRERRAIDMEETSYAGEIALTIHPGAGAASLTIPASQLAGVLLGSVPRSIEQGRIRLARRIDGLLVKELGAREGVVAPAE